MRHQVLKPSRMAIEIAIARKSRFWSITAPSRAPAAPGPRRHHTMGCTARCAMPRGPRRAPRHVRETPRSHNPSNSEKSAIGADHRPQRPLIGPHRPNRHQRSDLHGKPTPVTPAPVTPAPVSPAPVSPAPITPAPVTPAPVTPAPVTRAPVTPAPVTPAPVSPASVTPTLTNARRKSSRSAANGRPRVASRPISTRSTPISGRSARFNRAASFNRRRVRLRTTALPTRLVTVKPSRTGPLSPRCIACKTSPGIGALRPLAASNKNSARRLRRIGAATHPPASGRQALAALGAAIGQDFAAADRRHAGAESVPALADKLGRLIGALHGTALRRKRESDATGEAPRRGPPRRRRLIRAPSHAVNQQPIAWKRHDQAQHPWPRFLQAIGRWMPARGVRYRVGG